MPESGPAAARSERRQQCGQHHGRADGDHVSLEQIGGHAGAVANVVADVIGDNCGVAGIVLGNSGFDLADQISADVSGLGEDAAAQTREDRDREAPKARATRPSTTVRSEPPTV